MYVVVTSFCYFSDPAMLLAISTKWLAGHKLVRTLVTAVPSRFGMSPPLKGIKVLDLSRVLAAPMATMLLADLGCACWQYENKYQVLTRTVPM